MIRLHLSVVAGVVWASAMAVAVSPVAADLLPVTNFSFEADPAANGTFPVGVPMGWSLYDPNGIIDQSNDAVGVVNPTGTTFFNGGVPDGQNAALVFLAGDVGGGEAGLTQVLTSNLQANTRYTLSVGIGNIASGTGLPPFDSFGFFDLDGFPGYRVELLAGGVIIGQDDNSLNGLIPEGEFATSTIQVDIDDAHAQIGQPLAIRLINLNTPGTADEPGIEVDFDNVQLDATPLPEPTVGVLLLAGVAVAAGRRLPTERPQASVFSESPNRAATPRPTIFKTSFHSRG